jgi:hypothetical protein
MQRIFELEAEILTAVLPHAGERGRNDEERTKAFLARVLPKKFSIGTGFILCSNPQLEPSRQNDIVIFDEAQNAPLHRELAAFVFPIEGVYGIVEVKGLLQQSDLVPILENIAYVRALAKHKVYVNYEGMPWDEPHQTVVRQSEWSYPLAPRAFLVAYDASWSTLEGFTKAWLTALREVRAAHIHGVIVISKGWYALQQPYRQEPELEIFTDRALLRFTTNMTHALASVGMGAASMDRYLSLG